MSLINGVLAYDLFFDSWKETHGELIAAGIVLAVGSVLKAPLGILGDKLGGYVNLCHDLLERREKVVAACEALMPHLFEVVAANADPTGDIHSIIWMHRGSVPFISPSDLREIYWSTLKRIIEELWSRGSQIVLYAEGEWSSHLEAFAELPEKRIIFHADTTDIFHAHDVLGHKFCISDGNYQGSADPPDERNEIYRNEGNFNFTSITIGDLHTAPVGHGATDTDYDGDVDLAFGTKGAARNFIIRNDLHGEGNWLKVRLVTANGQAGAFGAKTTVYPAGRIGIALLAMRESQSNCGYLGQNDPVLHFGLGHQTNVDVVIQCLDRTKAVRHRVAANQTILITGTPKK